MSTELKVKEYLSKIFDVSKVTNEDNIFEKGLVNSLFAMQLIQFIEAEFDITLDDNDLDLENFKNINAIVDLIDRKVSA